MRPNTKVFFLESPTNPTLEIIDIAAIAEIAHEAGATLVVDNVFATPILQKPLAARRRLRRLFGDQTHRRPGPLPRRHHPLEPGFIDKHIHNLLRQTGPALSPFNAWVLLKSLETLPLRVAYQTKSAEKIADALAGQPGVRRVDISGPRRSSAGTQWRGAR